MVAKGKELENAVKKYLKQHVYLHHKFHDSHSARGIVTPVPADFIFFPFTGPAVLLECKESQKLKLPLTAFRPSQLKAMRQATLPDGVNYYIIVKSNKEYFLIHGDDIVGILNRGEKSIDLSKGYMAFTNIFDTFNLLINDNELE